MGPPWLAAGAGQDVGRSCILVSIAGKNVMLDCGMHMGYNDDVSTAGGSARVICLRARWLLSRRIVARLGLEETPRIIMFRPPTTDKATILRIW